MRTRPIRPDEIDLSLDAAGRPDHREEIKQYLQSMFAAGSMRPEWCFVIQEGEDPPLGRVAFWTLPGTDKPLALVLHDVLWEGDPVGVGKRLLGDVLDDARRLGAAKIEHVLDAPPMRPQFQHHPERRVEALEGAGFAFRHSWWRLAYEGPGGALAGLVMPAEPPGFLTIFYAGVAPGMRGRGYVDDLLAAGTAVLLGAQAHSGGEKPLSADTDVANAPMAAAFRRAGWTRFAGRREYVADLTPAPEDDPRPGGSS